MSLGMDVWYLSPRVPGQHSTLTPNLQLDRSAALSLLNQLVMLHDLGLYRKNIMLPCFEAA